MYCVIKTSFRTSKTDLDRLFACNRESARVWNDCLSHAKEHHKQTGKWIGKMDLQTLTKGQYHLHSQSIQSIQERYLEARKNAWKAKQAGYEHIRYPYKTKRHYPTRWKKDGFAIHPDGKIQLSMGIHQGKREKPVIVHASHIPQGKVKEIELIWDGQLMLAISYEDGISPTANSHTGIAAIDMGEIHGIAAVADTGQALIVTSRKLRSIKRLRNKKHAKLRKKQSRCKKSSRRWKKLQRAINKISSKTDRQQQDILQKMSRKFAAWADEQQVKTVVVGDVEGVQRNTSKRKKDNPKKKRRTRRQNQRLSQWPFGLLIMMLSYKLAALGIELTKIDESYTTQTCPVCGRKKKVAGRTYKCFCGYSMHRDIHGARNILAKHKYGEIRALAWEIDKITYLRPTG
ncbi:MAG: transposase [Clostridia bacterium]|nr:transposase [Clostridia bacterium]